MPRCRLLANLSLTNWFPDRIEIDHLELTHNTRWGYVKYLCHVLLRLRHYDAFLVFNGDFGLALVCFIARMIHGHRTSVFFFDILLQPPYGIRQHLKCKIKSLAYRGVDRFLCNHKDVSGYQRFFTIPSEKFIYIPWKANNYAVLENFPSRDGGYILAGGASWRDYSTLMAAVRTVGYPTIIVLPPENVARYHYTELNEVDVPSNVKIVRHTFDAHSWNSYLADSRIVVVPIKRDTIQSAGISVYLEAMALGKPVIVSDSPATRGLLTDNEAAIVPAGEPTLLAAALKRLWEDEAYRKRMADRGKAYALSLKGEDRLVRDILTVVIRHS